MNRSNDVQISVAELARVIRQTIEVLVIPELPRTSWSSGYLHSAVALLANIEARSRAERTLAMEEEAELSALLLEARTLIAGEDAARALAEEIDRALAIRLPPLERAEVTDLEARNAALSRALNSLIVWTYAQKTAVAEAYAPRLLELFAAYRGRAVARSEALLGEAVGMPIF